MLAAGVTLAQLAAALSRHVRGIIVDRTALEGGFDLDLQWTPDWLPRPAGGGPLRLNGFEVDPEGPSIFTALREQLGLALERETGSVPVLVIERITPPTPD